MIASGGFENPIYRVDDRLLHGCVIVGWGETLPVEEFLLADDQISGDELERELCLSCIPQDKQGQVISLTAAAAYLREATLEVRTMLVLRDCAAARSLFEAGIRFERLNLGGIHHVEGSRRLLPYIYLGDRDEVILRDLAAQNVEIYCQDLPGNHRYLLEELLHE